jgi:U3 small nucleolar RNA-associated protein 6
MEKVQFQLEQTLPELKDLYDKGLFSKHEIDQITKRRTAFETSLIRIKTRKDDFFKYAEYEINLERLRKVRWKKCGYHVNPPGPSASTYSLPRRTLYILKRATNKFPGDLAVWLAYVEYAAHQGMTKVVAKGLNSALQHHPLSPTLYLLLAHHHLHPGDPLPRAAIPSSSANPLDLPQRREGTSGFSLEGTGPARTTLLLGLRMLPKSHTLWREYAKLELGWVEGLRRRWRVLGLTETKKGVDFDGDVDALVGGDGAFGPEGEDARRAILTGQLVVHALESALKKVPIGNEGRDAGVDPTVADDGMAFREGLLEMLRRYPSPLRKKALGVVYADLERVAAEAERDGARARLALLTRPLYDRAYEAGEEEQGGIVLKGVELVDALGAIGKEVRSVAKKAGPEWADVTGAWLAERIAETNDNADLVS